MSGSAGSMIGSVLAGAFVVIVIWFYRHCARPNLALAGAPPIAFDVALACLAGSAGIFAFQFADYILDLTTASTARIITVVGAAFYSVLALGFLRPAWFTRLGGRDPSAPVRFILTWLKKEWVDFENPSKESPQLIRRVEAELEKVREPGNAALVDEWIALFEMYLRKSRLGSVSARTAERHLVESLVRVRPVDRLARFV